MEKEPIEMTHGDNIKFILAPVFLLCLSVILIVITCFGKDDVVVSEISYKPVEDAMAMIAEYEQYAQDYYDTGSLKSKGRANEIAFAYSEHIKVYGSTWDKVDLPEGFVYYLETVK